MSEHFSPCDGGGKFANDSSPSVGIGVIGDVGSEVIISSEAKQCVDWRSAAAVPGRSVALHRVERHEMMFLPSTFWSRRETRMVLNMFACPGSLVSLDIQAPLLGEWNRDRILVIGMMHDDST